MVHVSLLLSCTGQLASAGREAEVMTHECMERRGGGGESGGWEAA